MGSTRAKNPPQTTQASSIAILRTVVDKDENQRIRDAALRFLGRRNHSRLELRQKLRVKGFDADLINAVLTDLAQRGYQSDRDFARTLTRERHDNSKWGPRRIQQELGRKGISGQLIDEALEQISTDSDDIDNILPLARKRWSSSANLPMVKRRNRLAGFLQRRGYDWAVIKRIFAALEQNQE